MKRLWVCIALFLCSCEHPQKSLNTLGEVLDVRYQVLNNQADGKCHILHEKAPCFEAELFIESPIDYPGNDWQLYFSHYSPIHEVYNAQFTIERLQGDLHRLSPSSDFKGLKAQHAYKIPFRASFWHLNESDIFPNFFLHADGLKPVIVQSTVMTFDPETKLEAPGYVIPPKDPVQHHKRNKDDQTPIADAEFIYTTLQAIEPEQSNPLLISDHVIPKLKQVTALSDQTVALQSLHIHHNDFHRDAHAAALEYLSKQGLPNRPDGFRVDVHHDSTLVADAYTLQINDSKISIRSGDIAGSNYALYTLGQLWQVGDGHLPQVRVDDEPRYAYRGMHIDLSRNFLSTTFILELIQQMAAMKLNKLHLHLADDEGWRLAIKSLPELTSIGAKRCLDLNEQHCLITQLGDGPHPKEGQFLTQDEYLNILRAAKARNIEVIPSFDAPGHARAAIKSMEARYQRLILEEDPDGAREYLLSDFDDQSQYISHQHYNDNTINPCMESSYRFFDTVITEIQDLHQQAGWPLNTYHIGADESPGAWKESPVCKTFLNDNAYGVQDNSQLAAYFIERLVALLEDKGIKAAAWNDGLTHVEQSLAGRNIQSHAWTPLFWKGHEIAQRHANLQWNVVVSTPDATYFDFPHQAHYKERGFYWASRGISSKKVFDFMPDNLPAHAEIWTDRNGKAYQVNDNVQTQKHRFYGLQGQLWTEVVRGDKQAEYMVYPRLFALAERAWHKADWELAYTPNRHYSKDSHYFGPNEPARERDWFRFSYALNEALQRLDIWGIEYRLPVVGATIKDGHLFWQSPIPNLPLQYARGDGEWQPLAASQGSMLLDKPSALEPIKIRSINHKKNRMGRAITMPME
ncbi:family 20 glycosylhydrolase [Pseudoteredinibacter isoporae]|uniref:family 20 glycosylhydrolase n=1 Tax=Pseudoteredinibacter isoporae TaxID=570281 RepID=UPI0031045F72